MEARMKVEKIIVRTTDGKEYTYQNAIISDDEKNGWFGIKDDERVLILSQKNIVMIECRGKMEVNDEETN